MNKIIFDKLKTLKPVLKKRYGIEQFAIFGSQVRDDYIEDSDVDIAIIKMHKKDFDIFMNAKEFLEKNLKKDIDIGFFNSMKNFIKNEIEKEMIYV